MSVNILSRDLLEGAHNHFERLQIASNLYKIASNRFKSLRIASNRFNRLRIRSESLSEAAKNSRGLPKWLKVVPQKSI